MPRWSPGLTVTVMNSGAATVGVGDGVAAAACRAPSPQIRPSATTSPRPPADRTERVFMVASESEQIAAIGQPVLIPRGLWHLEDSKAKAESARDLCT